MISRNVAAMISSEVQRTLVKSPPELWAELSDPVALSRHLGELGEIRIVRSEPESTVEWAAENAAGTVSIKPSAWGTSVKLTVTREIAEPTLVPDSQPEAQVAIEAEPEPTTTFEPEPTTTFEPEPTITFEPEPTTTFEPEPTTTFETEAELEPRRGFLARLFGLRRRASPVRIESSAGMATPAPLPESSERRATEGPPADPPEQTAASERSSEPPDAFAAVRRALAPASFALADPFAMHPSARPTPAAAEIEQQARDRKIDDISAELLAAEEAATEEVTAVLTAVLDRLGAAHHRPFSRA